MRDHPDVRYVYFVHDGAPSSRVKIGMSIYPRWRAKEMHCTLLFAIPCEYQFARRLERALHDEFAYLRYDRGWGHGRTEWFVTDTWLRALMRRVLTTRRWPWDGTKVVV